MLYHLILDQIFDEQTNQNFQI